MFALLFGLLPVADLLCRAGVFLASDAEPARLPSVTAIAGSLGWAALIALLATAFAIPLACWWRGRGPWAAMVCVLPAFVPAYLAHAGWSQLRAPGAWLGDLLATGPGWVSIGAGRALAVLGLALWASPIAAMLIGPALRSFDQDTLDQSRSDGAGILRRAAMVLRVIRADVGAAALVVGLLMLGSAIPLHLAQIDTLALRAWLELDQRPFEHRGAAVVVSWPLFVIALAGALAATLSLARRRIVERAVTERRSWRWSWLAGLGVLGAGVLAPLVLFGSEAGSPDHILQTAREISGPLRSSLLVAGAVGGVLGMLFACTWLAVDAGARVVVAASAGVLFLTMLLPGVLVASAVRGWSELIGPGLADTPVVLALVHLSRFGAVALAAGVIVAAGESESDRANRRLDGVGWLRGFWAGVGTKVVSLGVIVGVVGGVLSLHEIEGAVIASPPGFDTLPRLLLSQLHFLRDRDLAASTLIVVGSGLVPALLLAGWGLRTRRAEAKGRRLE